MGLESVAGKRILLTGAGGSIGAALAQEILRGAPRELVLLDHSEQGLYELGRSLRGASGSARADLVTGDVGDRALLAALLEKHRPDLILHAAAYKHVPLMEENPFAAVKNNVMASWELARAAREHGVGQLLLISTDKAANPRSILGASKYIAERAAARWSGAGRRYASIRLVNVLGSAGSVLPLLLEQIRKGGPLTITHPEAARHFFTVEDTVRLILLAAALSDDAKVFVPKVGEPIRIVELADLLVKRFGAPEAQISTEFVGPRPGEKLTEELVGKQESVRATSHASLEAVNVGEFVTDEIDEEMKRLTDAVERRNQAEMLKVVCRMAPEYEPSRMLRGVEKAADD
jgi:FlaA1/EpsC-like NDP-sugar epimerase